MYQAIIIIHVLLGLGIIGLVLMQQGKGADAGAAFGTGASGSVFGAQGAASFLSRTTAILATLFFTTSLGLAVFNGQRGGPSDIMSDAASEKESLALPNIEGAKIDTTVPVVPQPVTEAAPVAPAPAAAATDQPAVKAPVSEVAPKDAAPAVAPKKEEPKKQESKKEAAKK
jgi:preprotein translocase subunit SecG